MSNNLNVLGICRRANKLSMGHDACKDAVRGKKASLCLVSCGASDRTFKEFTNLCRANGIPLFKIDLTPDEIYRITGYKAVVLTVNDSGFAESIMKSLNQTTFAEVEDL